MWSYFLSNNWTLPNLNKPCLHWSVTAIHYVRQQRVIFHVSVPRSKVISVSVFHPLSSLVSETNIGNKGVCVYVCDLRHTNMYCWSSVHGFMSHEYFVVSICNINTFTSHYRHIRETSKSQVTWCAHSFSWEQGLWFRLWTINKYLIRNLFVPFIFILFFIFLCIPVVLFLGSFVIWNGPQRIVWHNFQTKKGCDE